MPVEARAPERTLTTTEAAVLALLAIEGERSGYDLLKLVSRAIGHVWAPARSQLYAVLPRLVAGGLASRRDVVQQGRPDKAVYRLAPRGREVLDAWLAEVVPGDAAGVQLKVFVGGLVPRATLVAQVEQYRRDAEARRAELRRIDETNSRTGHDRFHGYLLDLGLAQAAAAVRWADAVITDLGERP
ncbi:MAG TPA: PadR family transcriptional regulator [Gaiellaceae bacterium]|nr:PadR family transcriptional regulator [Gaiellaceae bacterium]